MQYNGERNDKVVIDEHTRELIEMLMARLERISADSEWAHRASGVKGSLLRMMDKIEKGRPVPAQALRRMIEMGFWILEQAAREKEAPSV